MLDRQPDKAKTIPRGRFGSLRDMGDALAYLFSEAGDYVNGALLVIDGGAWHVGTGKPGGGFKYPYAVLSDEPFSEVTKRSKL